MQPAPPYELARVENGWVNFHVLRDAKGLYLLDAGFIGGRSALARELGRREWSHDPILGIIVTHGHLDHILNVRQLAEETGAWIAAPRGDAAHYRARPSYRGWSRLTGVLETMARPLCGFRTFEPDRWLEEGDELDVWLGLRVVGLPGHSAGHCGFLCEALKLFFCADLFASHARGAHFPPRIFNQDTKLLPAAVERTLRLDVDGILPNHGDAATPEEHLHRLRTMAGRLGIQAASHPQAGRNLA